MQSFRLLQSVLFAFSSFFIYPWKPLLNYAFGDSYEVGYKVFSPVCWFFCFLNTASKHFREDHRTPLNLAAHCICLATQLLGNFGFLRTLEDVYLHETRLLSLSSGLFWVVALLLFAKAPFLVNFAACSFILVAFVTAGMISASQIEIGTMLGFAVLFVAADIFRIKGNVFVPMSVSLKRLSIRFGLFLGLQVVLHRFVGQVLANHALAALLSVLLINFVACGFSSSPTILSVAIGMGMGRLVSVLVGSNSALQYFSLGFFGSFCQGESHSLTKEQATVRRRREETTRFDEFSS
jgi:hypothetical protein